MKRSRILPVSRVNTDAHLLEVSDGIRSVSLSGHMQHIDFLPVRSVNIGATIYQQVYHSRVPMVRCEMQSREPANVKIESLRGHTRRHQVL